MTTAAVFMSGNSQAVRLPKAFRLDTSRVTLEWRGDEIVIRPQRPTVRDLLKRKRNQTDAVLQPAWEEVNAAMVESAVSPPQERDWDTLLGQ